MIGEQVAGAACKAGAAGKKKPLILGRAS